MLKKLLGSALTAALVLSATAASAAPPKAPSSASRLSVAKNVRASASTDGQRLNGEVSPLIGLGLVAVVIAAALLIASDEPEGAPTSP